MKTIILVSSSNCKHCAQHFKEVVRLHAPHKDKIALRVVDPDNPTSYKEAIMMMKKYNVQKIPSIVILGNDGMLIETLDGLSNSLNKLNIAINDR